MLVRGHRVTSKGSTTLQNTSSCDREDCRPDLPGDQTAVTGHHWATQFPGKWGAWPCSVSLSTGGSGSTRELMLPNWERYVPQVRVSDRKTAATDLPFPPISPTHITPTMRHLAADTPAPRYRCVSLTSVTTATGY